MITAAARREPLVTRAQRDYPAHQPPVSWVPTGGAVVRADVMRAAGMFSELRINYIDADMWLRLGTAVGFVMIDAPVVLAVRFHGGNITQNAAMSLGGVRRLIDEERAGRYPGGRARRRERRAVIAQHVRPVVLSCARTGQPRDAWRLYRQTFAWNLRLGKVRFLAAFPLMAVTAKLRGGGNSDGGGMDECGESRGRQAIGG